MNPQSAIALGSVFWWLFVGVVGLLSVAIIGANLRSWRE